MSEVPLYACSNVRKGVNAPRLVELSGPTAVERFLMSEVPLFL